MHIHPAFSSTRKKTLPFLFASFLWLLSPLLSLATPSSPLPIHKGQSYLQHSLLQIKLHPKRHRFDAVATLDIELKHPLSQLTIYLHQMIELDTITLFSGGNWRKLPFQRSLETVTLFPPSTHRSHRKKTYFQRGKLLIRLQYHLTFFSQKNELFRQILCQIEPKESYFLYGWYPSLRPFADTIRGQLLAGERFSYRLELEVPQNQFALSSGILIAQNQLPNKRKLFVYTNSPVKEAALFFLSATFIRQRYRTSSGRIVEFYLKHKKSLKELARIGELVSKVERFYDNLFGSPIAKNKRKRPSWRLISFSGSGARGYAYTLILEEGRDYLSNELEGYEDLFTGRQILLHEMAHTWWGNALTNVGKGSAWLNEGLANYSSLRAIGKINGPRAEWKAIHRHIKAYLKTKSMENLIDLGGLSQIVHRIAYSRGTLVFYELERTIGRSNLDRGLRHFFQQHRSQFPTIQQFQQALEKISGRSLKAFFQDWIATPNLPYFRLKGWSCLSKQTSSPLQLLLKVENLGPIGGHLQLRLLFSEKSHEDIWLSLPAHRLKTFRLPLKRCPQNVLFDPHHITIHGLRWKSLLHRANEFRRTGKFRKAYALLKKLLTLMPHNGHALYSMGLLLQAQSHPKRALLHFQKALQHSSSFDAPLWLKSWSLFRIALLYRQLGQKKQAILILKNLLRHHPNYYHLHERIRDLLER